MLEGQFKDLQPEVESLADLVDGGSAGLEIGDHLRGDCCRIGRDALGDDAVIAGKDRDDGRSTRGG